MTPEEKHKLDNQRKECMWFAASIQDCVSLIERFDVDYKEEIIQLLQDKYEALRLEQNELFERIFGHKP